MICLPQSPCLAQMKSKYFENSIITCGNDRNIRFFPLANDLIKYDQYNISKSIKGFRICNTDNNEKSYEQNKVGNLVVLHEFDRTPSSESKKEDSSYSIIEKRYHHKDVILDMAYMERQNQGLVITASRDKTIKIWK